MYFPPEWLHCKLGINGKQNLRYNLWKMGTCWDDVSGQSWNWLYTDMISGEEPIKTKDYSFWVVPVDVEDPDEGVLFGGRLQGEVNVLHDPVEHAGVDVFGESVAGVGRLLAGHFFHVRLWGRGQLPVTEPVLHLQQLHTQQSAEVFEVDVVLLQHKQLPLENWYDSGCWFSVGAVMTLTYRDVTGLSVSLTADLYVSQMKDGGYYFKNVDLTAVLYPCRSQSHTQMLNELTQFTLVQMFHFCCPEFRLSMGPPGTRVRPGSHNTQVRSLVCVLIVWVSSKCSSHFWIWFINS